MQHFSGSLVGNQPCDPAAASLSKQCNAALPLCYAEWLCLSVKSSFLWAMPMLRGTASQREKRYRPPGKPKVFRIADGKAAEFKVSLHYQGMRFHRSRCCGQVQALYLLAHSTSHHKSRHFIISCKGIKRMSECCRSIVFDKEMRIPRKSISDNGN